MSADIVERLRAVRGASDRHRRWELQDMVRDALAEIDALRAKVEEMRGRIETGLSDSEQALLESLIELDDPGFKTAMESASTRFELLRTVRKAITGRRA